MTSTLLAGNDITNPDPDAVPDVIKQAQTYKLLTTGSDMLINFLPDTFGSRVEDFTGKVDSSLLDTRFVNSMVRKMYPHMTPQELDAVEQHAHDSSLHKSEEQVEHQTASDLLERYKQKKGNGELRGKEIPSSDIERLENVLHSPLN